MTTKIDYAIAALIGFFVGIFAIPTAYNLGLREQVALLALPWTAAALWFLGIWVAGRIGRRAAVIPQFAKFVAVGFLNTAIDFGILNLLSRASGITAGFIIGGVNLPGFLVAVFNSYLWNKFWVFHPVRSKPPQAAADAFTHRTSNGASDRGPEPLFADFPKFFAVTAIGVLINSGIVISVTTYVPPMFGLGPSQWLNAAKVAATIITLFWNFTGYKFVVFDQSKPERV